MKIWKVILAVLVIYGAGVVTGGMLVRVRIPARAQNEPPAFSNAMLGSGRQQFVQRLNRQLDLTPQQTAEVERILRESQARMAKIMEPVGPETREETRNVRQQIVGVLASEQKQKFNDVFKPRRPRDQRENRERKERTEVENATQPAKVR